MNTERACREFRNEAGASPWDHAKTFDHIHELARARGLHPEFRAAAPKPGEPR